MTVRIEAKKPQFELLPFTTAKNPAKNYIFNLLYSVVQEAAPARALDAGAGELRNRWMFPEAYFGITLHEAQYWQGIARNKKAPLRPTGETQVYVMRLESDFSFLGPMDLVVCTHTIYYVADRADVIARLVDRIRAGGALFLHDKMEGLDVALRVLEPLFEDVQLIYCAADGVDMPTFDGRMAEVMSLSKLEMSMPNRPEGHGQFCIIGRRKIGPAGPQSPMPDVISNQGLNTLTSEIPFLPGAAALPETDGDSD